MFEITQRKLANRNIETPLDLRVGDARGLPWAEASVDAVYTSFMLELFPLEEIPGVLAECKRVLRPGGRIGVLSMATVKEGQNTTTLEKRTCENRHRHFPHIVDCRPIDVEAVVTTAVSRSRKWLKWRYGQCLCVGWWGTRPSLWTPSTWREERRIGAFLPGRRQLCVATTSFDLKERRTRRTATLRGACNSPAGRNRLSTTRAPPDLLSPIAG